MTLMLASLATLLISGIASLTLGRTSNQIATILGVGGAVIGGVLGLIPALTTLLTGTSESMGPIQWNVPYGAFIIELDGLSALFIVPALLLTTASAVYGAELLKGLQNSRSLSSHWFFYNLATASIVMVALSRNGMLFLMSWEVMSVATYFLVTFRDESESVRDAGRTFLIAIHLGTAFLFVFFILLGQASGSMDFETIGAGKPPTPVMASVLFVLAVVGFGTKAGLMPFHVWLPEADPAAPSHVAAVMSGIMVKMGLYGITRAIILLPPPPSWWGWLLIGIGAISAVWGILHALSQHDVNRLLAYSTVENVGIIGLGLGLGLVGMSVHNGLIAILGIGGALWHALNHALIKGLLFLGAGTIVQATQTRNLNVMGGLLRRMPLVGLSFIVGAVAICGLPPLNGFIGEYFIYLGSFRGQIMLGRDSAAMTLVVIGSLAISGGLAVVAFTKVVGIAFLGQPRSQAADLARSPGRLMVYPMVFLATCCIFLGLGSGAIVTSVIRVASDVAGLEPNQAHFTTLEAIRPIGRIALAFGIVLGLASLLAVVRFFLLRKREVARSETWGCGYIAPTARMQYTASSYVEPVLVFFSAVLRSTESIVRPQGRFPVAGSLETETKDIVEHRVYRPLFRSIEWVSIHLRWLQHGSVHSYALYIAATLFVLLVWYFGWLQAA